MRKLYKVVPFILVTFLLASCGSNRNSNTSDSSGMQILASVIAPKVDNIAISPDGTKAYISTDLRYSKDKFDKEFEKPGLRVINIKNSKKPKIEKILTMLNGSKKLKLCNDIKISPDSKTLYSMWFGYYGVVTYNIEKAIQINHEHKNLYSDVSDPIGISSNGKKVYTTAHTNGETAGYIIVMDHSNKEKGLVDVGNLRLTNSKVSALFTDLEISKDNQTAYAIDGDGDLYIIDISDDESPELLSEYSASFDIKAVAVSSNDSIAYVGSYNNGVDIVDISDKKNPKLLHHLTAERYLYTVVVYFTL